MQSSGTKLAHIVRRNAGRHTNSNTIGTICEKVRKIARQHDRFALLAIIGLSEIDRVLVDPIQQTLGDLCQPGFGVPHGGGIIAVNIPEIALPLGKRIALSKFLGKSDKRIIDRLVTMRMITPHHITNDTR